MKNVINLPLTDIIMQELCYIVVDSPHTNVLHNQKDRYILLSTYLKCLGSESSSVFCWNSHKDGKSYQT